MSGASPGSGPAVGLALGLVRGPPVLAGEFGAAEEPGAALLAPWPTLADAVAVALAGAATELSRVGPDEAACGAGGVGRVRTAQTTATDASSPTAVNAARSGHGELGVSAPKLRLRAAWLTARTLPPAVVLGVSDGREEERGMESLLPTAHPKLRAATRSASRRRLCSSPRCSITTSRAPAR